MPRLGPIHRQRDTNLSQVGSNGPTEAIYLRQRHLESVINPCHFSSAGAGKTEELAKELLDHWRRITELAIPEVIRIATIMARPEPNPYIASRKPAST